MCKGLSEILKFEQGHLPVHWFVHQPKDDELGVGGPYIPAQGGQWIYCMRYQLQDVHTSGSCVNLRWDDHRVDRPEAEVSEGFHIRIFEDFSDVRGFSEKPGFPIRIIPVFVC